MRENERIIGYVSFHFICFLLLNCLDHIDALKARLNYDLESMPVKKFCEPCVYTPEAAVQDCEPKLTFFNLDNEAMLMLGKLFGRRLSVVFNNIWNNSLQSLQRKLDNHPITLAQIVSDVWVVSENKWNLLCRRIFSGEVTFMEIDLHFSRFDKNHEMIKRELLIACDTKETADRRLWQIEQYHRLADFSEGAKVMLDLRDGFQLTGNFDVVEDLTNLVSNSYISI